MRELPREIWVLLGASFLIAIGYGLIAPATPAFATSFGVGVTAASFVVSAFALVRLLFAPASGRLVTRFGERPVYLWGLSIVAVSTLATAFASNYGQLLLFRAAGGVGSTMFTVSAIGLLIRMCPPEMRGRVSGLWATAFLLGGIAGPAVGAGLVATSLRAPFLVYGGSLVAATLLVWSQLRSSALAGRADDDADSVELTLTDALRNPTYRAALASSFAQGWIVFGIRMSLVPLFVTGALHAGPEFAGVGLTVFAAANALTLPFTGRYTDRRGRKPPILLGLTLLSVGVVAMGVTTNEVVFLIGCLICGLGSGAVHPAQTATVADVLGNKARGGSVLAGFQMAADLGAVIGPLAAGAVAEHSSFPAAFLLTGAVAAVALAVWSRAPETLRVGV